MVEESDEKHQREKKNTGAPAKVLRAPAFFAERAGEGLVIFHKNLHLCQFFIKRLFPFSGG